MTQRNSNVDKANSRAGGKAITWVRTHRPDIWQQLLTEAYNDLDTTRHPVGRPSRQKAPSTIASKPLKREA